jgi:O-acetyl-ADP-ribose deacetylase (regulator of RNase III)
LTGRFRRRIIRETLTEVLVERESLRLAGLEIIIAKGDIARMACDAVVNAANNHLWMGSGVAGALKKAGGPSVEREAMALGPIEVGHAVTTGAGNLPVKWVIHAAVMGQDLETDADKVRRATVSAVKEAERIGAKTVALPALGTGVGGLAMEDCARAMRVGLEEAMPLASVRRVIFVLYGPRAYEAFRSAF